MKTRIVSTLALLASAHFLDEALFHPAETIVKNNVAVATVNGGDAAFVAQQAVNSASSTGHFLFGAAVLVAVVAIWFPVVKKWWVSADESNSDDNS